jgi:hypothetical protein
MSRNSLFHFTVPISAIGKVQIFTISHHRDEISPNSQTSGDSLHSSKLKERYDNHNTEQIIDINQPVLQAWLHHTRTQHLSSSAA